MDMRLLMIMTIFNLNYLLIFIIIVIIIIIIIIIIIFFLRGSPGAHV